MSQPATTSARAGAPPRTAYTVAEVAASIGVSAREVYRLIERNELEAGRLGRRVLVPVEAFNALRKRLFG